MFWEFLCSDSDHSLRIDVTRGINNNKIENPYNRRSQKDINTLMKFLQEIYLSHLQYVKYYFFEAIKSFFFSCVTRYFEYLKSRDSKFDSRDFNFDSRDCQFFANFDSRDSK